MADKFNWDQFEEVSEQDFNWAQFEEAETPTEKGILDEAKDVVDVGTYGVAPAVASGVTGATEGTRSALFDELDDTDVTRAEGLGRGIAQGATLGTADEIGGLYGSGFEAIQRLLNRLGLADKSPGQVAEELEAKGFTGDVGPTSLEETYRQYRDIQRERDKEVREATPGSFMAGELAGGMLLPGAGAGKFISKGAGALGRAKRASAVGGGFGAAAGLGTTEADLTKGEFTEAARDVGASTLAGATAGGGLSLAGSAARGITKAISNIGKETTGPGVGDFVRSYQLGRKGVDVAGKKGSKVSTGRVIKTVDSLSKTVFDQVEDLSAKRMAIAKSVPDVKIENSAIRDDIKRVVNDFKFDFRTQDEIQKILNDLNEVIPDKNLSLEEALTLSRNLYRISNNTRGPVQQIYRRLGRSINELAENKAPELAPLNQRISSGMKLLNDLDLEKPQTRTVIGKDGIEREIPLTTTSQKAAKFTEDFLDQFDTSKEIKERTFVEDLKSLFPDDTQRAEDIISNLKRVSRDFGVGKRTLSDARIGAGTQISGASISDIFARLAEAGGKGVRAAQAPKKAASRIYDFGQEQLDTLSERFALEDSPIAKSVAEKLKMASATPNERARNALLFTLTQNPYFREKLGEDNEE